MNTDKQTAILVAQSFTQVGGKHVVVSPGSRNAPLISSFQGENIELHPIVDERSAGFIALGIAIATSEPVGLICTSGTAILNYSPAIAEAYYLGIPLIVMSADRPKDSINQGIGQTINQQNVFGNFQKSFLQLPESIDTEKEFHYCNEKIKNCLLEGIRVDSGPVHINIPFKEPLYNRIQQRFIPKQEKVQINKKVDFELSKSLIEKLSNSKSILILCGILNKSQITNNLLSKLADISSVVVLSEHTSNLHNVTSIQTIDRVLELFENDLSPELVITLGENVISKKIKSVISESECSHWHVSPSGVERDTFGKLDQAIRSTTDNFVKAILGINKSLPRSPYSSNWLLKDELAENRHQQFIESCTYSDLGVFHKVIKGIPFHYHIQSGNSSVVRYFQLFKNVTSNYFHANRGTSGIDGSTSTAVGYALINKEPTLLVTGDLSFMYDSNGLWNNLVSPNLRIIIINNGGGGIFRIIPGPKTVENFETYFEGNHNMNFEGIISNLGLEYHLATDYNDLERELESFFELSPVAKVLEVKTPSEINDGVLKSYFNFIKTGEYEEMA